MERLESHERGLTTLSVRKRCVPCLCIATLRVLLTGTYASIVSPGPAVILCQRGYHGQTRPSP